MNDNSLVIEDLSFSYNDKKVLNKINLEIKKSDFIAVLGKSGAGKSTLLRCINLLNKPSGKILIDNKNIVSADKKSLRENRKKIAFIFQDYNVLDNLFTIDNVLTPYLAKKSFFNIIFGNYKKEEYNLALKYLEKVGLDQEAFKKCKYLSGGQKQRVAIARALCQNPNIILADEPISSLDEKNSEMIMDIFKKLNDKKHITVLINLHDINIAKKYCKKIIGLKNGKVEFYKDTESVTDDEFEKLYI